MSKSTHGATASRVIAVTKVVFARMRFLAVFVVVGLVVGYWEDIRNHWDKWTRPEGPVVMVTADKPVEYYCAMHPQVIRDEPGNCPICQMPLSKRIKGQTVALPADVLARVQLSPRRLALANVKTSTIIERPLAREIRTVGVLDYNETNVSQLSARVGGRVDKLFIESAGQAVKAGEAIYALYSPELYAAQREYLLARQRVNKLPAAATIEQRQDAAAVYNATMEKLVLWGVNRHQLDEMDHAFDEKGTIPADLVITSPISGIVIRKEVYEGGYINTGDIPFTVADLSELWLQAKVYEQDVPVIEIGQSVKVSVEALPGESFDGKVTFKAFAVDPRTRTLDARVAVANSGLKLRPGMFAVAMLSVPVKSTGKADGMATAVAPVDGAMGDASNHVAVDSGAKAGAGQDAMAGMDMTTDHAPAQTAMTDHALTPAPMIDRAAVFEKAVEPYLKAHAQLVKNQTEGIDSELAQAVDLLAVVGAQGDVAESYKQLTESVKQAKGADIAVVRKQFETISAAMITIGKVTGQPAGAAQLQVFRCPMKKANWLQVETETRNPYYAPESHMLGCGGAVETLPRAAAMPIVPATRPAGEAMAVLAAPRSAVINTGKRMIVYVESSPGVFDMRQVNVGAPAGDYYPILSGLEKGEKVVTVGAFLVDAENHLNPSGQAAGDDKPATADGAEPTAAGAKSSGPVGAPAGGHQH